MRRADRTTATDTGTEGVEAVSVGVRVDPLAEILTTAKEGWRELGSCMQVDAELFFPVKGSTARAAKRVCAGCPVREECLAVALRVGEQHGVWGGTTPNERARLPHPRSRLSGRRTA